MIDVRKRRTSKQLPIHLVCDPLLIGALWPALSSIFTPPPPPPRSLFSRLVTAFGLLMLGCLSPSARESYRFFLRLGLLCSLGQLLTLIGAHGLLAGLSRRSLDLCNDTIGICPAPFLLEATRQRTIGHELATLIERPYLTSVLGLLDARREAAQVVLEVLQVSQEKALTVSVVSGISRLWKVDNDRTFRAHQDVVLGQVAVDHTGAKHVDALSDQVGVQRTRLIST